VWEVARPQIQKVTDSMISVGRIKALHHDDFLSVAPLLPVLTVCLHPPPDLKVHSAETDVTGDGADGGLDLKMKLQLKRTKGGRLEVAMLECEAGKLTMETNSGLG
ncbi:hypothetical protein KUCAC02_036697, partial [Chaenocephalus aceratus]